MWCRCCCCGLVGSFFGWGKVFILVFIFFYFIFLVLGALFLFGLCLFGFLVFFGSSF